MKKRFIPATVAALALTFSAVAVPQAVAEDVAEDNQEVGAAEGAFEPFVTLDQGAETRVLYSTLASAINAPSTTAAFNQLEAVEFSVGGNKINWLSYDYESGINVRNIVAEADAPVGNHVVTVSFTYSDESDFEAESGDINVTIGDATDPLITKPANLRAVVGTPIELISIEVEDATPVTVTVSELPAGLDYDSETRVISGTPTATTDGPLTVTIRAVDSAENDSTETFTIDVDPAPLIVNPGNKTAVVGVEIEEFTIGLNENAEGVNAVDEINVEGLPAGLSFDPETNVVSGTPTGATVEGTPAVVTVTALGEDEETLGTTTFEYTVGEAAEPAPLIVNPGNKSGVVGTEIEEFTISIDEDAEDAGAVEQIKVDNLPEGVTFNEETGVVSGTPTEATDVDEPAVVSVTALDEEGETLGTTTFTFAVSEAEDDDDGSSIGSSEGSSIEGSSADDINWGLVGLGGVLAAVIGVIAAIGGGFIQLPPAIANLIPFL